MEMALPFPVMRMVVFVQRLMRTEWLIEAAISTISEGESKYSMIHLLPSRVLRAGFFVRMLSGLGFLPGRGDLLLVEVWEDERTGPEGTAEEARREGFFVRLGRGVDFAEVGGYAVAGGDLGEYGAHVCAAFRGGGAVWWHWRGRWGVVEVWKWRWWRWTWS